MSVSSIIWLLFKVKLSRLVSNLVYPGTVVPEIWLLKTYLAACLTPY